jgi:hypothetical protein
MRSSQDLAGAYRLRLQLVHGERLGEAIEVPPFRGMKMLVEGSVWCRP